MGLYDFKPKFVPFIESGAKTHTIRNKRKNPDKPGNIIHCYCGLRRKGAKLIGRFECVKVEEIEIRQATTTEFRQAQKTWSAAFPPTVSIDGEFLSIDEREALARRDGFSDFHEMMKFWDGRLPFSGHIIHWRFEKRTTERRKTKGWKFLKRAAGLEPERRATDRRKL